MKKVVPVLLAFLLVFSSFCFVGCEPEEAKEPNNGISDENSQNENNQNENNQNENNNNSCYDDIMDAKPVIYLYPQEETDVQVTLDYNGQLWCTYPAYGNGWSVTAYPDGTLIDKKTGLEYSYLFWEGISNVPYDMSRGFVVKGEDTAAFLQQTLAAMGLTPREYNEFIVYWLPRMQGNAYNLITFQTDVYTENAKLTITPKPDSMLRVFMAYQALEEPIEIEAPTIKPFEREGFCVVEWGGAEVE